MIAHSVGQVVACALQGWGKPADFSGQGNSTMGEKGVPSTETLESGVL